MKRALLVVVLAAACSSPSAPGAAPSPSPSVTPQVTAPAPPDPTRSATPPPTAPPAAGPVGTAVARGFFPRSATFVSDRTGWVLGRVPCPRTAKECAAVVRTRDGGRTWRQIPAPPIDPDSLGTIRFANLRDGFVGGTQLWATHDGGATWKVVPGQADAGSFAAAAGRVWLLRDGLRSAPAGGGPFVAEPGTGGAESVTLHGPDVLATTLDGFLLAGRRGGPFARRVLPCEKYEQATVGALTGQDLLLVCAGDAGAGQQPKTAWTTTDQGRTWTQVGDPAPLSGTEVFRTKGADFVVNHALSVGVSRDGGRTWTTSLQSEGGISEAGFASAALGYAIGCFQDCEGMQLTHDAGRHWTAVRF